MSLDRQHATAPRIREQNNRTDERELTEGVEVTGREKQEKAAGRLADAEPPALRRGRTPRVGLVGYDSIQLDKQGVLLTFAGPLGGLRSVRVHNKDMERMVLDYLALLADVREGKIPGPPDVAVRRDAEADEGTGRDV